MIPLANYKARIVSLTAIMLMVFGTLPAAVQAQSAAKHNPRADHAQHRNQAGQAIQSEMQDGIQVVEIRVTGKGFLPQRVELKSNVPARLVFKRTEQAGCADQVQIPAFGIEKTDLPLNKPVTIEFTPKEGGEYAFACGMDMVKGAMMVKS